MEFFKHNYIASHNAFCLSIGCEDNVNDYTNDFWIEGQILKLHYGFTIRFNQIRK